MKGGSFLIPQKILGGINMKEKQEYEFYEQIKDWSFKEFEIVSESLTDWDMYEILESVTDKNSRILDLGTGGGEKLLKSFPKDVLEIVGTDYSKEMIKTAKKNLKLSGRSNVTFKVMNNLDLKFPKEYFDVVVARNTVTDPSEIYKVLKPGGYLLVRGVDKFDCHQLKMMFGRGQAVRDKTPISIIDYEAILNAGFRDVELVPIHVREYFKDIETLYKFLLKVPIIDDFSEEDFDVKDFYKKELEMEKLEEYVSKNTTDKGIILLRRYYGIIARK